MKYDWDASTYDRISDAQESWGHEIIEYRKWKGNEVVLDAGCGSGRTTKILLMKVPEGKVIAVDSDLSMIRFAKENLVKFSNIEFIQIDISEIELEEKVDVIFSNATLHWILNHKKVFQQFWQILKPDGQLLIQCGGHRNLAKTLSIFNKVSESKEFNTYFCNNKQDDIWNQTWYFAKKEDTERILQEIGFRNIQVFLEDREAKFTNKEEYFLFIKTIVLIPYLKYLPNDMLKDKFTISIVEEIETNAKELQWKLDYVRLNINAIK
ncbi:MAG TPA: methyltransferase domain-containing protein [Nitrososphaeraceae archaeon]|nr:methyltransferase domain-containing protein [Nitrososphaeraceae archaeon]